MLSSQVCGINDATWQIFTHLVPKNVHNFFMCCDSYYQTRTKEAAAMPLPCLLLQEPIHEVLGMGGAVIQPE